MLDLATMSSTQAFIEGLILGSLAGAVLVWGYYDWRESHKYYESPTVPPPDHNVKILRWTCTTCGDPTHHASVCPFKEESW